jgi:hypothetical protein
MRYPTGLVHTIFTAATPINDCSSQIVQIAYRNDTEAEAKAADIIAFDRAVVTEDREVLESTRSRRRLTRRWTCAGGRSCTWLRTPRGC